MKLIAMTFFYDLKEFLPVTQYLPFSILNIDRWCCIPVKITITSPYRFYVLKKDKSSFGISYGKFYDLGGHSKKQENKLFKIA